MHIDKLHEWIPHPTNSLDPFLFYAKLAEIVPAEAQNALNKFGVQVRIAETGALESINEETITSGQTSKSPKKNLCHERVSGLTRLSQLNKRPVRLSYRVRRLKYDGYELLVVVASSKFPLPQDREPWGSQLFDYSPVRSVGVLEEKARSTVHPPTRQIEPKLKGREVSIYSNLLNCRCMKISITMLPRAIAVMFTGYAAVIRSDLLSNRQVRSSILAKSLENVRSKFERVTLMSLGSQNARLSPNCHYK
jgi:hypothetical protein